MRSASALLFSFSVSEFAHIFKMLHVVHVGPGGEYVFELIQQKSYECYQHYQHSGSFLLQICAYSIGDTVGTQDLNISGCVRLTYIFGRKYDGLIAEANRFLDYFIRICD